MSKLARILDSPFLARVVPHLAPETLHQLIQHQGLEASGELVAAATPAQLTSLLDLDLWRRAQPGLDEQFDVNRFGEWLEVLVDTGDSIAARTVAALDANVVVAGLSRYVRVFDPGIFEPIAQSDDEQLGRRDAMHEGDLLDGDESTEAVSMLECEVGGYLVRARRTDAWDAIITLLVTLEIEQYQSFHAVMQGCRQLSNSNPEIDGLDDILLMPEQHLHDVTIEREQRRSQQGYATAADARAFLQMARQPRAATAINPIAAAYFRAAEEEEEPHHEVIDAPAPEDEEISSSINEVVALLAEAGVMPGQPRALLAAGDEDPRVPRLLVLRRLMEFVLHKDETAYLTRSRELAFLANTLLAGSAVQSRPFTPSEASDAAACICNLGLESIAPPDAFLVNHDLVAAFEAGWSVLYKDVSLFVADELLSTLATLRCSDADTRRELRALQRSLEKHRAAGAPWLARDALDVLAMLDMTAWTSVRGLLDECPILPAALTAMLEHRTTAVDPTAFDFISTSAQIDDIRLFMRTLPVALSS